MLRAAVLSGANTTGKSNLVRAVDCARDFVLEGKGPMKRIALNPFRFTEEPSKPSFCEVGFRGGTPWGVGRRTDLPE